jgi:putative choline sulfate-utilization transcription factor
MHDRKIDLGWMRIFAETVRCGSFSAAANALGLTQPAVSYQIRRVEEQTGQQLLYRRRQGVQLTPQGRRLYEIASRTVAEIDELMREYRAVARRPVLRLRTDYAFSTLWLMPRMSAFRALHPGIDIQIVATQRFDRDEMEPGDVAIAFGARTDFNAGAVNLLPETVVPVCTPDFLNRHPELSDIRALADTRLIHLDATRPSPWFDWNAYLSRIGAPRPAGVQGDLHFNTYNLVVQAAIEHQGVAIGWTGLIDSLLRAGVLVSVGPSASETERGYFLVRPAVSESDGQRLVDWLLGQTADTAIGALNSVNTTSLSTA